MEDLRNEAPSQGESRPETTGGTETTADGGATTTEPDSGGEQASTEPEGSGPAEEGEGGATTGESTPFDPGGLEPGEPGTGGEMAEGETKPDETGGVRDAGAKGDGTDAAGETEGGDGVPDKGPEGGKKLRPGGRRNPKTETEGNGRPDGSGETDTTGDQGLGESRPDGQPEPESGSDVDEDERTESQPDEDSDEAPESRQQVVTAKTGEALEQECRPPSYVTKTYPNAKALPEPLAEPAHLICDIINALPPAGFGRVVICQQIGGDIFELYGLHNGCIRSVPECIDPGG